METVSAFLRLNPYNAWRYGESNSMSESVFLVVTNPSKKHTLTGEVSGLIHSL